MAVKKLLESKRFLSAMVMLICLALNQVLGVGIEPEHIMVALGLPILGYSGQDIATAVRTAPPQAQ